jgi:hypothetical protein
VGGPAGGALRLRANVDALFLLIDGPGRWFGGFFVSVKKENRHCFTFQRLRGCPERNPQRHRQWCSG